SLQEVLTMVLRHEAEVGLIILPQHTKSLMLHMLKDNELSYQCLSVEPPIVITRKGHPLMEGGHKTVTLEMLQNYPLVMYRDSNTDYLNEVDELGLKTSQ
ncbi:MAG: LysR family transcriptional regulator substrate-binding protein, partial [Oscillospiraceae bacterium]|nr:LysR family transcriptional regulator substrate-binding protein [Oscillospiraceae bacterium]